MNELVSGTFGKNGEHSYSSLTISDERIPLRVGDRGEGIYRVVVEKITIDGSVSYAKTNFWCDIETGIDTRVTIREIPRPAGPRNLQWCVQIDGEGDWVDVGASPRPEYNDFDI